jgi:putative Holliday junction resolvase
MRVLGVDYGRKRIGLALSDATGLLARPWKSIEARDGVRAVAADLAREIRQLQADPDGIAAVVLGFPRRLSGEPNEQTPVVEKVAAALRPLIADIPVVLQDERLSSHAADQILAQHERDWKKRKPLIDAAAAAVILQDYLDARPR